MPARSQLVWHARQPSPPRFEDFTGSLQGPEECTGSQFRHGVEPQLHRCYSSKAAATATKSPEQLRLMLLVHSAHMPVGSDDIGRDQAVRCQPIAPG